MKPKKLNENENEIDKIIASLPLSYWEQADATQLRRHLQKLVKKVARDVREFWSDPDFEAGFKERYGVKL